MNTRGINGVNSLNARHNRRNYWPGQFVDESAEGGVLLRRPADYGEWPNRAGPMADVFHPQNRKRMRQAVIAKMVAKRALRFQLRTHTTSDDKVRVRENRQGRPPQMPPCQGGEY